nr:555_t:CDS:2 [Entrophospora candida]
MSKHEHKFVITLLVDYLKVPNGNMIYDPSTGVVGQLFHFNPSGVKELIVLNVAIYPNIIHVRKPSVQHPGTSGANML